MSELDKLREEIGSVDRELAEVFEKRMRIVDDILKYKQENGLPVYDPEQEARVMEAGGKNIADSRLREHYILFLKELMNISKSYQYRLMSGKAENTAPGVITVERDAIWRAGSLANLARKVLVVSDDGIPQVYTDAVLSQCAEGFRFIFPQGEKSKSLETFSAILETLLKNGFTRSDAVVAVGGGVTGDLAGFAASCYMRGIDFINIPTTLLSQLDSSVGGKTGVDFGGVKNSVGSFHHPVKVIIDPGCLRTLPRRELNAGLAEAVKMAATCSASLFRLIAESGCIEEDLEAIITEALRIKIGIVEQDPDEKGLRKVLNFGHTVGHAIEAAAGGRYLHGECVAMGMPCMASPEAAGEIRAVLEKYGLPCSIPFGADELMPYILHDKKMASGKVTVVYVDKIGSFEFREAEPEELESYILKQIGK